MKIKDYFTPKSYVYTGKLTEVETRITHYQFNEKAIIKTEDFDLKAHFKHYIQVVGLSDVEKIQTLKNHFDIEGLVLEDIFNVRQRNKIEMRNGYVFAVFHISYLKDQVIVQDYMSLLMFSDTIITFHEKAPYYLDVVHDLLHTFMETRKRPIDFLFFQILDLITDRHLEVYDFLEEAHLRFEEYILESKRVNQDDFYVTRKHLLKLKNNVSPILEQLEMLLTKQNTLIDIEHHPYFEDLKDHLKRLDHQLNQAREMMRQLLDLHMNNQSNQMNKVMTTLTLFSAIFIPLSFLTGFFGMNFVHFEVLELDYALEIFITLCVLLAVGMVILFKRKKWL